MSRRRDKQNHLNRKMTANVVANCCGLTVVSGTGPGQMANPPTAGNYGKFSHLVGPDGVKVELVTKDVKDAPADHAS